MDDLPLWASLLIYAAGGIAVVALVYLVVLTAVRQALRQPQAEARTARRRQEDLLREIASSTTYLADVADAWAEGEAERRSTAADSAFSRPPSG